MQERSAPGAVLSSHTDFAWDLCIFMSICLQFASIFKFFLLNLTHSCHENLTALRLHTNNGGDTNDLKEYN